MPLSRELNENQRQAVDAVEGPLILTAGPGTGKTHTFAHKIAHLLLEQEILARNILAVTFTRSAAREMRDRLQKILASSPVASQLEELWVGTFHALALRILQEQGYPFGPGTEFSVLSEEDKSSWVQDLIPRKDIPAFLRELRSQKQALKFPMQGPGAEYQKRILAAKLLDFDDLFLYACRLLDEKPEVLSHYQERFHYILVDEFQDTSFAQYRLLRSLSSGNVCVIGDPDQAIYSFAGNSFKPFEEFSKDYPEHRILPLSENYRSQARILEAAKQVIRKNQAQLPRELYARLERGLPIEVAAHASESQEAEMIGRKIEGLLGGASYFTIDSRWAEKEKESYQYGLGDIAILYRFHAQARKIEEALQRAGLPCRTFGKKPGQGDAVSIAGELEDFQSREEAAPSAILRGEWVSLMTLHRSKGLEFPVVFLAGCEEGVFGDSEEERRLFYVGMTRAKNRLFLSYAKKRFLFGKTLNQGPSRFLRDIEEELRMIQENRAPAKKTPRIHQTTLFD